MQVLARLGQQSLQLCVVPLEDLVVANKGLLDFGHLLVLNFVGLGSSLTRNEQDLCGSGIKRTVCEDCWKLCIRERAS